MAKKYAISRTFVYMLQTQLNTAVEEYFYVGSIPSKKNIIIESREKSKEYALLLRLVGKCSIPAISDILKRMGLKNNSVGTISQKLNEIGKYLPNTFNVDNDAILYVYLAADEMFSHSIPILISVDPVSTAILRIELAESRKTEDWINHFNKLKENGIKVILVVSDEGQGICSATGSVLSGINRQPDTFHAISHRLGKWVNSLENSAYAAIAEEYHCEKIFESAKTEDVLQKRMEAYFEARTNADKTIMLYEVYKFLYHCIIDNLQVFDKDGNPCDRKNAEENIRIALDYMIGLPINKIKKNINTIYNLLDDLLEYLDTAREVINRLYTKGIPHYIIQAFALAWQYQKNATKAKKSERRKYFANKEKKQLEMIRMMLGNDFESVKTIVFVEFDKIIQTSAIVENINSIVRAFLNTSRNRINQEILNLIMFYHNHRRYKAGKRKGKTPMELLTGIKQEKDWLEMLLNLEKEKKDLSLAA
ncbi:MAG: transposase [Bacteroidia bacterium]|nr:transposase [Bacteroidia bacterium]